jgi:hypothetical protein
MSKILVDICMTIFLILSFIRWEADGTFHFIAGSMCALLFAVHILIHRKWLSAVTKSCLAGKLKKKLRWRYAANILLLVVWGIAIVSGFLAIGYFAAEIESMYVFSRLHAVTTRVGLAFVLIHVIQHRAQIASYFKRKKKEKVI